MTRHINPYLYWTPRILSILFICFLALFSLDVFEPGLNAWQILTGLFMHNIPVLTLSIILWISWKREVIGGITFLLAGTAYVISVIRPPFGGYMFSYAFLIAGPAYLIGILFLMNWHKKRNG